MTWKSS